MFAFAGFGVHVGRNFVGGCVLIKISALPSAIFARTQHVFLVVPLRELSHVV